MHVLQLMSQLAEQDHPIGTIAFAPIGGGIWKRMDGIENVYPGSGIDYRFSGSGKTFFFERVA